ncbi:hypothetical protein NQZ68_019013 [Dissostichus eleginoides]|nr:hypothetical protein NQZ68_019013 [Dissostichus eleginoides]
MTAKHRKGKNNYKHEDNFFKNDVTETEVRGGGNNIALHLVLFLLIVICGATGSWFCFQQHQTLTYLTDNLMGMQMKIVKLQSSHEDMRQSNNQQQASESMEIRLNALEDSYALAQKQAGMALATAEQLRTSDLPAQVMSLHTEMKNRLAEMQQATVSLEQLSQLQSMLRGKSDEFEVVRIQVEGLSTLSDQLSQKVEGLTGSMGEAESKLDEVATLSASMDGQAAEVQMLKQQLENYQAQLEASTLEMANVRGLIENEQLQQGSVEEQIDTPVEETVEEVAPAVEEEAAAAPEEVEELPADVEEEASNTEAEGAGEESEEEAAAQEVAPVELEDSVTDEAAPAEDAEEEESAALSEKTEEEESVEETQEAEEVVSEGDGGLEKKEVLEEEEEEEEQQDVAAEEEAEETDEEEEPLENDASPEDECTMQAFVPRSYLTPVRDEEAESQRKAKSRHARQTRRSTQGVTLTDLKEAQKTTGASPAERQTEEGICLRKGSSDDRRVRISPTESTGTEISMKWSKMDDQGNIEPRLEAIAESPIPNPPYSSVAGSCGLLSNTSFRAGERMWRDENQNPVEKAAEMTFAATLQQKRHFCERSEYNTAEGLPAREIDRSLSDESSHCRAFGRLPKLKRVGVGGGDWEGDQAVKGEG